MTRPLSPPTEAEVRAAVARAYRRHRGQLFPIPPGRPGDALLAARRRGWVRVPLAGIAAVTVAGIQALVAEPGVSERNEEKFPVDCENRNGREKIGDTIPAQPEVPHG